MKTGARGTSEVTAFVISAGNNPNYEDCIAALKWQSVLPKIEVIKDYSPMDRAFQEMLNRVTTPYFIQVDNDMILDKEAVSIMLDAIKSSPNKRAMLAFKLRDVHLSFDIYGVKIYKSKICKRYTYQENHPSCEMDQLERIQKDGFTYSVIPTVVGKHSPLWTDEDIFIRYYGLMKKYKIYGYDWISHLPRKIYNLSAKFNDDKNFFALAGILTAIVDGKELTGEKNFRDHNEDFVEIKSMYCVPTTATAYVTSKCNFKCSWCRNQSKGALTAPDIHPTQIETLLLKYPTIQGVCCCGYGEPLLSNQLVPIVKMIKKHNKICGIITNGSLLKRRLPELLECPPDYISVSVNAPTREKHREITGTDEWDNVLDGIRECVKSGITCYLSAVITKDNLSDIPALLALTANLRVKGINLHNILPHLESDDEFWEKVLTKEDEQEINKFKNLPNAHLVLKWPTLLDREGGYGACNSPWEVIAVDGSGGISICNSVIPCSTDHGKITDENPFKNKYCMDFRRNCFKNNPCRMCFRNWRYF